MISIILPFIKEWPQVVFTIRSIAEGLKGFPFEVIAIDNLQKSQGQDRGTPNVKAMAEKHEWLKYYRKQDLLSHWQCKNFGMSKAKYDVFMFIDAHCIVPNDFVQAVIYYRENWMNMKGSMHLPLTYHILESKRLIYKAVFDVPRGDYAYTFHTWNPQEHKDKLLENKIVEVPAMSTCGMMVHKTYMDRIGGWPTELGIYSGGEHFLNYVFATTGLYKWVYNSTSALYHHGDKRGYNWNHHNQQRNRAIATYMIGGEKLLLVWLKKCARLRPREQDFMFKDILEKCVEQRELIRKQQVMSVVEFANKWKGSYLAKGDWG